MKLIYDFYSFFLFVSMLVEINCNHFESITFSYLFLSGCVCVCVCVLNNHSSTKSPKDHDDDDGDDQPLPWTSSSFSSFHSLLSFFYFYFILFCLLFGLFAVLIFLGKFELNDDKWIDRMCIYIHSLYLEMSWLINNQNNVRVCVDVCVVHSFNTWLLFDGALSFVELHWNNNTKRIERTKKKKSSTFINHTVSFFSDEKKTHTERSSI